MTLKTLNAIQNLLEEAVYNLKRSRGVAYHALTAAFPDGDEPENCTLKRVYMDLCKQEREARYALEDFQSQDWRS